MTAGVQQGRGGFQERRLGSGMCAPLWCCAVRMAVRAAGTQASGPSAHAGCLRRASVLSSATTAGCCSCTCASSCFGSPPAPRGLDVGQEAVDGRCLSRRCWLTGARASLVESGLHFWSQQLLLHARGDGCPLGSGAAAETLWQSSEAGPLTPSTRGVLGGSCTLSARSPWPLARLGQLPGCRSVIHHSVRPSLTGWHSTHRHQRMCLRTRSRPAFALASRQPPAGQQGVPQVALRTSSPTRSWTTRAPWTSSAG